MKNRRVLIAAIVGAKHRVFVKVHPDGGEESRECHLLELLV
jgi:hypothetical protein